MTIDEILELDDPSEQAIELTELLEELAREMGINKLTPAQRTLLLVVRYDQAIHKDGLASVFTSTVGDNVEATVAALGEVGAEECARALEEAVESWPQDLEETAKQRSATYQAHAETLGPVLSALEKTHVAAFGELESLVVAYAAEHADEL